MKGQPKRFRPRPHIRQKPLGISLMLESDNTIVGVSHHDHLSTGLALTPLLRPQIEYVVQVDVCQQMRDCRSLRRTHLAFNNASLFKHSGL